MSTEQRRGIWYALVCYVAWGVFPLYWKALGSVPAIDILANRMAWSMVLVVLLLLLRQDWAWLGPALRNRRIMLAYLGAAALLTANWYIYIYAVNADYVVETSLGYFINPLISVVLAVVFLHERQRAYQWMAIGLAAAGVLFLTWTYGNLPWIALSLALTFGFYGLLKKRAPWSPCAVLRWKLHLCLYRPSCFFCIATSRGMEASATCLGRPCSCSWAPGRSPWGPCCYLRQRPAGFHSSCWESCST